MDESPKKCDIVCVYNLMSNGILEHPAIVTRRWTGRIVNLMVLPDAGVPFALQNIEFFQTREEAVNFISNLDPENKYKKIVAFWPLMRDISTLN